MIENGLLFLLGFLSATLIALVVAPAYRARVERLTRRRLEASIPLSRDELQAERDRFRAEHAMEIRRLEVAQRELKDRGAQQLIEIGRLSEQLARAGEERQRFAALQAEAEKRAGHLGHAVEQSGARLGELERGVQSAEAARAAHAQAIAAVERKLEEAALESSNRQIDLVARESEIERLRGEMAALSAESDRRLAAAEAALAAARAEQATKGEAAVADIEAAALVASEREALKEETAALKAENRRLKAELAEGSAKARAAGSPETDALLRVELAGLAAQVVALTARLEGEASPIHRIIAVAPPGDPDNPTLADRIRLLQQEG